MIFFGFDIMPVQASTVALPMDTLYLYIVAVSVFFTVLIFGLVLFFSVKYRRRSDAERPKPIEGNHLLEIIWVTVPLIIVMTMFVAGAILFFYIFTPPKDGIQIYGVGKQWMWKFQHPEGRREINDLHVPLGVPVKMMLTSEDVIHDFFVPAFRVKIDVVPGRYTQTWFKATKVGEYHLFCSQYCGTKHSQMIGKVIVLEPADFAKWLAGQDPSSPLPAASMQERGAKLFQDLRCVTCHGGSSGALGPDMKGVYGSTVELEGGKTVTADDAYLRESIIFPTKRVVKGYQPLMPTYQGQVAEEDILAIISYIKTLTPEPAAKAAAAAAPSAPSN